MAAQGWKHGEFLGAKNASHANFHTAANASHIRAMIKDDNLGLGAKIGSGLGHGECTGLDAFKNILGRLNGKDEDELEEEQKSREELKRAIYTEKRWGSIRFVQGGFLVGDKIQRLIDAEAERTRELAVISAESESDSSDCADAAVEPEPVVNNSEKSKKRKFKEQEPILEKLAANAKKLKKQKSEEDEERPQVFISQVKDSENIQKSNASPEEYKIKTSASGDGIRRSKKKSKLKTDAGFGDEENATKLKKQRKGKRDKMGGNENEDDSKSSRNESLITRALKKKAKRNKKIADAESLSDFNHPTTKEHDPSTPPEIESGRSTPIMMKGRHAVRARNIAQKRLSSMDVAALNQVSFLLHIFHRKVLTYPRYS